MLIVLLASFVQGLSGFGFALVSIPLLSILIDIKEAVPLAALCGLVINIFLIIELKNHIKFFELKYLLIGSAVGIPIGTYFLSEADPELIGVLLGIIILLFVFLSLTQLIEQKGMNLRWGYLFGILSGLLGGAFNTNGPPVLIYFYLQGWDKFKQKASITGFFIVTSLIIVTTHAITGITTEGVMINFFWSFPSVIAGIIIGNRIFKKISTEIFNKIVLYGLIIIGIFMIFRS